MPRFRKRPVEIEAHQWTPGDPEAAGYVAGWISSHNGDCTILGGMGAACVLGIHTLEGVMEARPGDWVIRGVKGEFYPCKPDIFAATYEPVEAVDEQGETAREDTEPTLAAIRAAAERVRAANHAAYDAPGDPPALYDRVAAVHELLVCTEQLLEALSRDTRRPVREPRLSATAGDPGKLAQAAADRLVAAAGRVGDARYWVNRAWSDLAPLYIDDETGEGDG